MKTRSPKSSFPSFPDAESPKSQSVGIKPGLLVLAFSLYTLAFLSSGCSPRPLHGGRALTSGPITQSLAQTENPSAPSSQSQETILTRSYTIPAFPTLLAAPEPAVGGSPNPWPSSSSFSSSPSLNRKSKIENRKFSPPPFITMVEKEESRAHAELGASQKDTSREFAAKLSSLKPIVWVGLALFTFGIASLFWPPLQTIIGSVTTSMAITLGGLALIILPTLIVGNELLLLAGVTVAIGAWFLAHRHGHLRGQLAATTSARSKLWN